MRHKEATRMPAAAGFLVPFSIIIPIVLITFAISILLSGCTSLSRAQESPDERSENSPSREHDNPQKVIQEGPPDKLQENSPGNQKDSPLENQLSSIPGPSDTPFLQDTKTLTSENIRDKENPVKSGVTFEGINVSGKGRNEVEKLVSDFSGNLEHEPKNAEINPANWEVSKSEAGVKVNIEKTVSKVMEANDGNSINVIVDTVEPAYSQKQLQDGISVISQFNTPLVDKSPGRVNNIKLAAKQIDYYIVAPGKEFSFNRTVGRTLASEGYQKAIIIGKDNKREYEVGGGICQLSTTLYNTAVMAGLKIIERHPHTTKVPYVAKGKDAMVNDGNADMRFLNNRKYPVMIRTEIGSGYVKTWLMENRNE